MEFLPRTLGTRPRMACEIRSEGVVAARAEDAAGLLAAVSRAETHGVAAERAGVVAALRKALDAVCVRGREVTLVVPDSAVRVLLLDFDELPTKPAEALPVVRFRLKKLLPFDADDAAVSYQVMSTSKGLVRVVAVAMPRDVLAGYESMVREAGFEPGAVLPSTLAAIAGLVESASPVLVVNVSLQSVTTAIVKAGVLLLHRSLDLRPAVRHEILLTPEPGLRLPLVDRERSAEEWARQEPVGYGDPTEASAGIQTAVLEREITEQDATEPAFSPAASEIAQAISVAAAYFEDTLESSPNLLLATGTLGADALATLLEEGGIGPVPVVEMVDAQVLGPGANTSGRVPLGWLSGVRGALAG